MASGSDKLDRVVEARMKLRDRFLAESHATPSMADPKPLGSGPVNRHGMPKLPIDQVLTHKWPVLDLGAQPQVSHERWRLVIDGALACCSAEVSVTASVMIVRL